jgi:hypothetical protein
VAPQTVTSGEPTAATASAVPSRRSSAITAAWLGQSLRAADEPAATITTVSSSASMLGTTTFLHLLLLPIGASYCELTDLTGESPVAKSLLAGLGNSPGLESFWWSRDLSVVSVLMVAAMIFVQWKHKKHFLSASTELTLSRLKKWEDHLLRKANRIKQKISSIPEEGSKGGPTVRELQIELKACWIEKTAAHETRKRLEQHWRTWKKAVGLDGSGDLGGYLKALRRAYVRVLRHPKEVPPDNPQPGPTSSPIDASMHSDEPIAMEDAVEYLWNMYFVERTRRQSLAKRSASRTVTTEPTWWEFMDAQPHG